MNLACGDLSVTSMAHARKTHTRTHAHAHTRTHAQPSGSHATTSLSLTPEYSQKHQALSKEGKGSCVDHENDCFHVSNRGRCRHSHLRISANPMRITAALQFSPNFIPSEKPAASATTFLRAPHISTPAKKHNRHMPC